MARGYYRDAPFYTDSVGVKGDRQKYFEILARLGIAMLAIADRGLRGAELKHCCDDATKKAVEEIKEAGIEISFEPVIGKCALREFSGN